MSQINADIMEIKIELVDYPTKCRAKAMFLYPKFIIRLSIILILDFVSILCLFFLNFLLNFRKLKIG